VCPDCESTDIIDRGDELYSRPADFFRCRACNCYWMLPKHADEPATHVILGARNVSADIARGEKPPFHRVCLICEGRGDLLESLTAFSGVSYYRCQRCLHVWIHRSRAADVDKAS